MPPGPSKNINTANSISGQQLGVASDAQAKAGADYNQFKALINPLVQQQTRLATGNRSDAMSAAMPWISKLSAGFTGAKEGLMNTLPPGAARDKALADLEVNKDTTIAGTEASAVQNAPSVLAGVGSSIGNMSLQELGAALSGLSGGAQTNQGAGQMAAMQQQAMLSFFGQLAGAGGGIVSHIPGMGPCWIAEAIYGEYDLRTHLVRAWLRDEFSKKPFGMCVIAAYQLAGRQVAWVARRSPWLRSALKPLFDIAFAKSMAFYSSSAVQLT
jgi:hypothetical protein